MPTKLFHRDLNQLGKLLGHPFDGGICHGFSLMLSQALLAHDEKTFYKRLHLIAQYKAADSTFASLLKEINQARESVKNHQALTENESNLIDLLAFYDGVGLYLNPTVNKKVLNQKRIDQLQFDIVYPFAQSIKLQDTSISIPLSQNYVFDKARLKQFLTELAKVALQNKNPTPVSIVSVNHSVCLSLTKNTSTSAPTWDYVDTNDFQRFKSHQDYFRRLSTDSLADSIIASLSDGGKSVVINVSLINSGIDQNFNDLCAKFAEQFPVQPGDINQFDDAQGLIHSVCRDGDLKSLRQLIAMGADIKQKNKSERTPLYLATVHNHPELVKLLIAKGTPVNEMDKNGRTLLHSASALNSHKVIKLLIEKGAIIDQIDNNGRTPLHFACMSGEPELVKLLLDKGSLVNHMDTTGTTPLFYACDDENFEAVKLLIQNGAKVKLSNKEGLTPLHQACASGSINSAKLLLENGAPVDTSTINGSQPLHYACISGKPELVKLLLDKGSPVNSIDKVGNTPLFYACNKGNFEMVKLLLQNGAKVNLSNKKRLTPLSIAKTRKHHQILEELKKYSAIEHLQKAIEEMGQYAVLRNDLSRGQKATELNEVLTSSLNTFIQNKGIDNPVTCKKFIRKCTDTIASYKKLNEFTEHRAYYKVVLANIALALTGFGALFVIAKLGYSYATTGKPVGFFDKTKGFQHLVRIENKVSTLPVSSNQGA